MSSTVAEDYFLIQEAWNRGESGSDIYHMIHDWIVRWKESIEDKEAVADIWKRMRTDSINDIVEDFIYGERYAQLRLQFAA